MATASQFDDTLALWQACWDGDLEKVALLLPRIPDALLRATTLGKYTVLYAAYLPRGWDQDPLPAQGCGMGGVAPSHRHRAS